MRFILPLLLKMIYFQKKDKVLPKIIAINIVEVIVEIVKEKFISVDI